jgi:hypothetical protein
MNFVLKIKMLIKNIMKRDSTIEIERTSKTSIKKYKSYLEKFLILWFTKMMMNDLIKYSLL